MSARVKIILTQLRARQPACLAFVVFIVDLLVPDDGLETPALPLQAADPSRRDVAPFDVCVASRLLRDAISPLSRSLISSSYVDVVIIIVVSAPPMHG